MLIGGLRLKNPVLLAPMSGVTDLPFRTLAARMGAGAVVSEMIASEQLVDEDAESTLKLAGGSLFPHIVQLAGREAKWMDLAARRAREGGADIIDINMGCPAKKVTSGYSGSALMRDLDHAMTLIEATVNAVDCPVTLKMRLGWDETSVNAGELARRAVDAGVQMITVHGRTRCQFYNGAANWGEIAKVGAGLAVPLTANGDVTCVEDAAQILRETGASGVMIGRGAYGRPWLPGHAAHYLGTGEILPEPDGADLVEIVLEHYEALLRHYGPLIGMRAARKHLAWYLDANPKRATNTPADERQHLLTATDIDAVLAMIRVIFSRPADSAPDPLEREQQAA